MSRSVLHGLLLAALFGTSVGACRTAAEADVDSPGSSVAGTETKPATASGERTSGSGSAAGTESNLTLVAVTAVRPTDATPCERLCGNLGDCLIGDQSYTDAVASGLEFECLDMCVHAREGDRAKTEFLACGTGTECGELQACAEASWAALADARVTPALANVVTTADPCVKGCRWFYACYVGNAPPGQAYVDPSTQVQIDECASGCETASSSEKELMIHFATCMPSHCSQEQALECFEHYAP